MSDPVRVSGEGGDGSALERELLESLRDVSPRGDEKARAWSGIAAQLAAAGVAAGTAATASSAAAAESAGVASGAAAGGAAGGANVAVAAKSLLLAKWALVAAAVGGTAGAGYWLKQSAAPSERTPAVSAAPRDTPVIPAPPVAPVPSEPAPVASVEVAPAPPRAPSGRPSAGEKRSEGKLSEQLAAESALLTEARARVRAGDFAGADARLERLRREFPAGVLSQEREVLAIELLAARGKANLASQRARIFVEAHPKSPHSERLRRFVLP